MHGLGTQNWERGGCRKILAENIIEVRIGVVLAGCKRLNIGKLTRLVLRSWKREATFSKSTVSGKSLEFRAKHQPMAGGGRGKGVK